MTTEFWLGPPPLLPPIIPNYPPTIHPIPPPVAPPGMVIVDVRDLYPRTPRHAPASIQQATVAGANSLLPIVYGRRRVGAKVVLCTTSVNTGADLVMACAWAQGEIDAIEELQINDEAVSFVATPYNNYVGNQTQNADAMIAFALGAAYTDTLRGIAYTAIRVPPGKVAGFPRMTAKLRGMKVPQVQLAYIALNGTSSVAVNANGTQNTINEDFEVVVGLSATDWTPATDDVLVSKWNTTGNQRGWRFLLKTTGALALELSTTGSTTTHTFTSAATLAYTDSKAHFVRMRLRKTNGSNSVASFAYAEDGQAWTALGSDQTGTTIGTMFASTAELRIGADHQGNFLAGNIWVARVQSVAKLVCDLVTLEATGGASSFTDRAGAAWTLTSATVNSYLGWSRIPVNCLVDLLTNATYGLGRRVDIGTALQTYYLNTDPIGTSPENRHELDLLLDASQPADAWVRELADYAHCRVVEDGERYLLVRDWDDPAVKAFDTTNIIEGSLTWNKRGSRDQPTCVEVTYTNVQVNPWRDDPVTVYLPGVLGGSVARRMARVSKPGITRYSEAYRRAVETLNDATTSDVRVSLRVFDDAATVREGAIVTVTHPIGFTAKKFRVQSIEAIEPGRWQIRANEFDSARYSSEVVPGPTTTDTTLPSPSAPPAVTGLTLTEELYQTKDGLYSSRIKATWTHTAFPFVLFYAVEIYEGTVAAANIRHRGVAYTTEFITPDLKEGVLYTVQVWIRTIVGVDGAAGIETITPQGKYLPPGDVPSVTGFEAGGRVFLSWGAAIDLTIDTIRYEIRYGATTAVWDTAIRLDRVSALTWASPGLPTGTYRFLVKALDSVGNYSATAAYVDVTVSVDHGAFSAYSYADQPMLHFGGTEFSIGGVRYATTDWADGLEYGHATQLNTSGTMDDGTMESTVMTQPHRSTTLFDGSTRYVAIPHVAAYNVGTAFTLEAWIFPRLVSGGRYGVFSTRLTNPAGSWQLEIGNGSGGTGRIAISGNGDVWFAESVSSVIPLRKWTHIAVTVSGTGAGSAKLYVNGAEVSYQQTNAYTCSNNSDAKRVGEGTSSGQRCNGGIVRTKLWNKALTAAELAISMQYHNDPTTITGMVGAWTGADGTQGDTTTTYADASSTANNGTVNPSADWWSWHQALNVPIDLGQTLSGTFTVTGEVTALNGVVVPMIKLSNDGINYTEYRQPSVVGSARHFHYGYEAQGGSMLLNLTTLRGDILVTPRSELGTLTCAATGIQTAYLTGLYAKVVDLQLTPAQTANAWFAVPDQVEVGAFGIVGGVPCIKWLASATNATAIRTDTFTIGTSMTVEFWAQLDTHDATNGEAAYDLPNNTHTAANLYVNSSGRATFNGAWGTDLFLLGTQQVVFPVGRWVHVAVVVDNSASNTKLYLNGVLAGTTTYRDPTVNTSKTWRIGYSGATFGWQGRIYDFRVWNEARTAQQIVDNYRTRVSAGGNLALYLKCDEKSGTSLADSSGSGDTFTMAGSSGTDFLWRPINGFDVYLFDAAAARQAGDVRYRWTGA